MIPGTPEAPRELFWEAGKAPARVGAWFGPHGVACPVCNVELRAGAQCRIVLRFEKLDRRLAERSLA